MKNMKKKNSLAYSVLTDRVVWIDGKGKATDITDNFHQVMLLWLTEGEKLPKVGEKWQRLLNATKGNEDIAITYEVLNSDMQPNGASQGTMPKEQNHD